MKTIVNFGVVLILLFPFFFGCNSDDSEEIISQEPQAEIVDTLVLGDASAGELYYQLDKGSIYYYGPGMDPMTRFVIELTSQDYDASTKVGDILVFEIIQDQATELASGTYTLGSFRSLSGGYLHTPAWDYTLREGKVVIEKNADQYRLSWEFKAYREGYRISETRNVYLQGSFEGTLPQVPVYTGVY